MLAFDRDNLVINNRVLCEFVITSPERDNLSEDVVIVSNLPKEVINSHLFQLGFVSFSKKRTELNWDSAKNALNSLKKRLVNDDELKYFMYPQWLKSKPGKYLIDELAATRNKPIEPGIISFRKNPMLFYSLSNLYQENRIYFLGEEYEGSTKEEFEHYLIHDKDSIDEYLDASGLMDNFLMKKLSDGNALLVGLNNITPVLFQIVADENYI